MLGELLRYCLYKYKGCNWTGKSVYMYDGVHYVLLCYIIMYICMMVHIMDCFVILLCI